MGGSRVLLALGIGLVFSGCSKSPPSASPPPTPPSAAQKPSPKEATLRLATAIEADAGADPGSTAPPAPPAPPSLAGKTVLHVGDSMVGGSWGLTRYLEAKFTHEGATFVRDTKISESITSFDKSTRLKDLLAKHDPAIVILTLGTNDALVPYPQSLGPHVASIVKRLAGRECYWMGPPLWKPDSAGLLPIIRDNVAPCRFYDGSHLKLQRGEDGIHPTDRGGADWANAFWTFFRAQPPAPLLDAGVSASQ
jgi:hypothetical protein